MAGVKKDVTNPKVPATIVKATAETLAEMGFKFDLRVVDRAVVHANPWNPNKMDERTQVATRESIATFGFIDPVTVREHPDIDGHYQIIDGEHRWIEAGELGYKQIPIIVLLDVDDVTAKKLTIVFNETRGEADSVLLGGLLANLKDELGDGFMTALRYDDGELKHLLELADADWNRFEPGGDDEPPAPDDDAGWFTITMRVPSDARDVWDSTREAVLREHPDVHLHDDEKVAAGQLLEILCATFLASAVSG